LAFSRAALAQNTTERGAGCNAVLAGPMPCTVAVEDLARPQ
jgi:hypothetical protein